MQHANAAFPQTVGRRQRLVAFADRYGSPWMAFLLFVYFLCFLIGVEPMPLSHGVQPLATGSTSVVRQVMISLLFVSSLPVLFCYRRRLIEVLRANVLPLLVYAWLASTALWSMHPPLTLRRIIAEVLLFVMLTAAVSAMRSWRLVVYPAAAAAAVVVMCDMAAVILVPGLAIGPIGALGIHSNKNLAGLVTLVALILCGGTFLACRNWRIRAVLLPVLIAGFVFIVLTRSKTSLGLVVLIYAVFPVLYLVFKRWSAAPAMVPVLLASVIAFIVLVTGIAGISRGDVLEFIFGDATLTRRTELWAFLQASIDQYTYFGSGWGAFWDTGSPINPINAPAQSWVLPALEINTAHNGYIDIWMQAGLVGLGLVVAMVLRVIWVYACLLRQRHWTIEDQRLIATMFAVVVALALYNFLESILFRPADSLSVLFMLAVVAGQTLHRQTRHLAVLPAQHGSGDASSTHRGLPSPQRRRGPADLACPLLLALSRSGGPIGRP